MMMLVVKKKMMMMKQVKNNNVYFLGDITQKGYEKKRAKLLAPFLVQSPGNVILTHSPLTPERLYETVQNPFVFWDTIDSIFVFECVDQNGMLF